MQRPALATLACINPACQHVGRPGQGNLAIRKVYGKDHIRLLRCCGCHEEFSERRNTALFNTKVREAKAEEIIDHLDAGCRGRATSRRTKVAEVTVARLPAIPAHGLRILYDLCRRHLSEPFDYPFVALEATFTIGMDAILGSKQIDDCAETEFRHSHGK